jgi:hypothetical protein
MRSFVSYFLVITLIAGFQKKQSPSYWVSLFVALLCFPLADFLYAPRTGILVGFFGLENLHVSGFLQYLCYTIPPFYIVGKNYKDGPNMFFSKRTDLEIKERTKKNLSSRILILIAAGLTAPIYFFLFLVNDLGGAPRDLNWFLLLSFLGIFTCALLYFRNAHSKFLVGILISFLLVSHGCSIDKIELAEAKKFECANGMRPDCEPEALQPSN